MFEQTIDKIRSLSALIERQQKAEATKQVVEDLATQKAWKEASKSFANKLRAKKEFSTQVSLSLYKKARNANVFKHSQLGTNRLVDSDYVLQYRTDSDVRNNRRWIDRLPQEMHSSLKTIQRFYMLPTGSVANIVQEGDPKPLRERSFVQRTFLLQKIAVTDLITQEVVYALPSERLADYILDSLLEHVYDRLEQFVTTDIINNALIFAAANYAGYIYRTSGANASWHDLLSAMQREYEYYFHDLNFGVRFADIMVAGRKTMLGILNDRHNEGQDYLNEAHDVDGFVLDRSNIYWSEVLSSRPEQLLLLNSDAFELHMLDAVEVYMERVAERTDERNLYRLVAEVYYTVVPRFLGELTTTWPALVSNDTIADRNAL